MNIPVSEESYMRPSVHYTLPYTLAETYEQDRHRGEERRHAHHRALLEGGPSGPSLPARLRATILARMRPDHSLTDYPCRLPDGSIGRVAVVQQGGEWALLCRIAGTA
jgi:hypothetical protein